MITFSVINTVNGDRITSFWAGGPSSAKRRAVICADYYRSGVVVVVTASIYTSSSVFVIHRAGQKALL